MILQIWRDVKPKRGKISEEEIEEIKKNRVTVAHGESNNSSAPYVQDAPRSPLSYSISQKQQKTTENQKINQLV